MKKTVHISLFLLLLLLPTAIWAQEQCANGTDDDSDGLIDLNDPDCSCNAANVSLIANPSFEINTGCPSTFKQFNLVSNWVSGNGQAIDYINSCGFTRFTGVPFPDGNGIAGCFYLEDRLRYVAQCLPSPLASGTNYTLNFEISTLSVYNSGGNLDNAVGTLCGFNYNSYPFPFTVALYGTPNCTDLPWAGNGSPVGSGAWVLLGQVTYSPNDTLWNDLSISFNAPSNIAAVAIGPPNTQITQFPVFNQGGQGNLGCFPFVQYDNFILNESNLIADVELSQTGGYCTSDLVFNATCNIAGGTWQWYRNGIALTGETNAALQVSADSYLPGYYTARYSINGNCFTDDYLLLPPHSISVEYATGTSCYTNIVAFTDMSFGGAYTITNRDWDFGDGNTSTERNPVHRYTANGTYNAQLVVTTDDGCKDTISKPQVINQPSPLALNTCTCNGLGISLIPNHSFEDHSCCPSGYSQLNCADTWIQASGATSDYWHTCGSTNSAPLPPPDGNGFAGYIHMGTGYQEFIGACLVEPMLAGNTYNLKFQMASTETANFAFWGAADCNALPFGGSACPQGVGSWQILSQQVVPLGGNTWHTVTMSLTLTQDIYAVLLGPDCSNGTGGYAYYYVDNLSLSSSILQPVEIQGAYCTNDITLHSGAASDTFNLEYQWFKDGIELVGETDSVLDVSANGYGVGDYQVMGIFRDACDVSPIFRVDTAYINFDIETVISCPEQQNGQILVQNVVGAGVTLPFVFQLNNAAPVADSVFSNILPGSYQIKVIDSKGCADSATVTVNNYAPAEPQFSFADVCAGDSVLFTDLTTVDSGSIASWTWNFGDGTTSSVQSPHHGYTTDGHYTVSLIAETNRGCKDTLTDTVRVYLRPTVNAGTDQTICSGSTATLSGIIGASATSATWSGGGGSYTPNATTLTAVYTPSSTDTANGTVPLILTTNDPTGPCTAAIDTVVITINPLPTVNAGSDQTICIGNSVVLAATLGGAASSGTWSGGDGAFVPDNTSSTAVYTPSTSENTSGTVTLTYTTDDPAGPCVSVNDQMTITINQLPTANAGSPQYVCAGSGITLAGSIGGTATSGSWSGGAGIFNPSPNALNAVYTPTASEFTADSVILTLTTNDPAGPCTFSSSSVTMHFYRNPVIDFVAADSNGCPVHCTNFINSSTVGGGDNIVSWSWDFDDGTTSTEQSPNHCFSATGFYDISLTATSNHSCTSSLTLNQHIQVYAVPTAAFTPTPNPATVLEPTIVFSNQSSNDVTYWHWNFGDGDTLAPNIPNPEHSYAETAATYTVTLTVHNATDCYDTTMKEIVISPEFSFFIPNAFSPNGDGHNDFFFGAGVGITAYDLWIFDRWGDMVFHSDNISEGWNGRANFGTTAAQIDVYIWKVALTDIFDKKHSYTGTVTLVR